LTSCKLVTFSRSTLLHVVSKSLNKEVWQLSHTRKISMTFPHWLTSEQRTNQSQTNNKQRSERFVWKFR